MSKKALLIRRNFNNQFKLLQTYTVYIIQCNLNSWNDIECQSKRNWICKIAKGKSPLAPPTEPPKRGEVDPACGTDQSWVSTTSN